MKIKKIWKLILGLGMLMFFGLSLSACGNPATQKSPTSSANQSASQSAQNTKFRLYHGAFLQANGIISTPLLADNGSQDDVMIASRNLALYVDGQKVPILQQKAQPADFHVTVGSQSQWTNLVSFYVGTKLSDKDLGKVQLVLNTDDNKKMVVEGISPDDASSTLSNNDTASSGNNKTTDLSDYYSQIIDFQKDQLSDSQNSPSLEDKFNDNQYDNLHTFMVASTKSPNIILMLIHNGTNTDFTFDLSNFEVIDKDGQETLADPEFRNYTLQVPHGKYADVLVKMEGNLKQSEAPYTVRFKNDDGNFFDTKQAPYPVEMAMNSATDFQNAFVGAPDELGDDATKWTKAKLKGNELNVNVKLTSYFNLKADNISDYQLVGVDSAGNDGDTEKATDGAPLSITSNDTTKLKLKFDDLKNLKTYKHIYLNYRDKRLCKVK